MNYLNYNGQLTERATFKIDLSNRGFLYGDGLFESIRCLNGKVLFFNDHYQRLVQGLEILKISVPEFDIADIEKKIQNLASANEIEDCRIKLMVWRKSGGLFSPQEFEGDYLITAEAFKSGLAEKTKVGFAKSIKAQTGPLSSYKTLSSVNYILGGIELKENQWEDLVMLDEKGNISECLASSIFWIKNNVLHTPSLDSGCIDGIIRKNILRHCQSQNISFKEGLFNKEMLLEADTVFSSNIAGISKIKAIGNKEYSTEHPLLNSFYSILT